MSLIDHDLFAAMGMSTSNTGKANNSKASRRPLTNLKPQLKRNIRITDEQQAVNRYLWTGLPAAITSQELERFLYYKGQVALFFEEGSRKFYIMPYALDGTLDFYGRENRIHPVPLNGEDADKRVSDYLSTLKRDVVYAIPEVNTLDGSATKEDIAANWKRYCVILRDYTPQLNATTCIPRATLQEPIIEAESECIPLMRTSLISNSGVTGVRAATEEDAADLEEGGRTIYEKALTGDVFMPLIGKLEFQELGGGHGYASNEFMMAMSALDNYRLSQYGLNNGGVFEKSQQMSIGEQQINDQTNSLVMDDGLYQRMNFAIIANAVFGTNIAVSQNPNCSTAASIALDGRTTEGSEQLDGGKNNESTTNE